VNNQTIPLSAPISQFLPNEAEIRAAIDRVLKSGLYLLGPESEAFETELAKANCVAHAIGVGNGTDGLAIALRALGINPGDEVITVSHTAIATVAAILMSGAIPVLVDINHDYYTLDPQAFEQAITKKTRAIIPVHLYGQPADLSTICEIAARHNIPVIEDCAQAQGARHKDKLVGTFGEMAALSFYPTKALGAIGDGGAILTNNSKMAETLRSLRQYGWDQNRIGQKCGVNSRLDEIQAAILRVKLPLLAAHNRQRAEIARRYDEELASLSSLIIPQRRPGDEHIFHLYVIACERRDGLSEFLAERNIITGIHYPVPAHLQPGYGDKCILPPQGLPVTEATVKRILSLPIFPGIQSAQIDRVVAAIKEFYQA